MHVLVGVVLLRELSHLLECLLHVPSPYRSVPSFKLISRIFRQQLDEANVKKLSLVELVCIRSLDEVVTP